jgi:hypothetical protein
MRRPQIGHFRSEGGVPVDQILRNHAGVQNFAPAIKIGEKQIQRLHALNESALERFPLPARQDARQYIEGYEALGRFLRPIDGEGDADSSKQQLRLRLA